VPKPRPRVGLPDFSYPARYRENLFFGGVEPLFFAEQSASVRDKWLHPLPGEGKSI
jgi:hypothetical protein